MAHEDRSILVKDGVPAGAHWVRFPRFFGDAMMIHAALAPLRAAGLPLVAWGPAWILDLFDGCPDYVATVPDPARKYSPLQAASLLRSHHPASVINFPKSHRPMIAAFLARVPLRLGCGDGGAWLFYTHSVAFYQQDTPFVERYASVVRRAFPALPEPLEFLPFRPRNAALEEAGRDRAAQEFGDYVVLAPGANSSSKFITSPEAWIGLGRHLLAQGLGVVILGGTGLDQELAKGICQGLPKALDLTGKCGLPLSAAWICGARGLVGMDSGLTHVAAGSGVPTLALFGPTRPRHSQPWGPRVRTLRREGLPCLECMSCLCPVEGHPCMDGLTADQLWSALQDVMGSPSRG